MSRFKLIATAAACLLATPLLAETVKFHATMSPDNEVPPAATSGSGTADATLDTATKKLDYTITFAGLSGPATMAHFHGPAPAGKNAGVAVPLGMTPVSPLTGSATLTDAQIAELQAGNWYANVHTAKNPKGELRGQMEPSK